MNKLTDFGKGVIAGVVLAVIIFGVIFALMYFNKRDKELIEYAKKQMEIEALQEDVSNRDPAEFIDTVPGVRRTTDTAADEFKRKRDKAVQRFRSRNTD